ncbi:putative sucrose-phosphate synthase 4 [Zea mays]|uniref:Putative sucrose-phosphate synthase 4 n=1 Tax=Zea mays TaxID=4577 RepID=A0A3L6E840_MAIZE|nr:putative sucrose-phosphate synthase 4 [Zea mays]
MRSPQEKNTRLENMTWRIWNLARKKKEVHFREHQDMFRKMFQWRVRRAVVLLDKLAKYRTHYTANH